MMECLNPADLVAVESPYIVLLRAAMSIPIYHYIWGLCLVLIVFLYAFLEIHFLQDLFTGFRGQPVILTFNPSSYLYQDVISKCKIFHERYLSTPWLCSPHLQTLFIHFFGNSPVVNYRRQLFITSDGGTIALDWVKNPKDNQSYHQANDVALQGTKSPMIIIIPGLTSDSDSAYVKHLAFKMVKHDWTVVVVNHRGLGGVSITSDRFYNAGWTEDIRHVIDHIHNQFSDLSLFVVGTSIGANIVVKYLGEDGINSPITGAAAICSPWDPLICDRFINRRLVQRLYNKALAVGLKDYAHLHEEVLSRLSDWDGVKTSRSVRDFDDSATRLLSNYETVDTYYRHCASVNFIRNVKVPLLCISALDDPVCTAEAIPWDECRLNNNVVLVTTQHGGHLPFLEGLTAKSVWWTRAVDEFFSVLVSTSPSPPKQEIPMSSLNPLESPIDHAPYVQILEDGIVAAVGNEVPDIGAQHVEPQKSRDSISVEVSSQETQNANPEQSLMPDAKRTHNVSEVVAPVVKSLNQITLSNQKSIWLLGYIAIITTWPLVGSALAIFFRKKFQNRFSLPLLKATFGSGRPFRK